MMRDGDRGLGGRKGNAEREREREVVCMSARIRSIFIEW